jgi:hypothetical protein
MASSIEYRRDAEDCLRVAKSSSPETKAFLIMMAGAWHRMAQNQENIDRFVGDADAPRAERRDED